jgi:hypothetical protein
MEEQSSLNPNSTRGRGSAGNEHCQITAIIAFIFPAAGLQPTWNIRSLQVQPYCSLNPLQRSDPAAERPANRRLRPGVCKNVILSRRKKACGGMAMAAKGKITHAVLGFRYGLPRPHVVSYGSSDFRL